MKMWGIEGHPDLLRDPISRSVINSNVEKLNEAKALKQARLQEKNRIENLEKDVSEMKQMLQQILDSVNGSTNR